jgi:hypothetical protein
MPKFLIEFGTSTEAEYIIEAVDEEEAMEKFHNAQISNNLKPTYYDAMVTYENITEITEDN